MQARMNHPVFLVPDALPALQALSKAVTAFGKKNGVSETTLNLISLRASQINGCSVCVDMHARDAKKAGERDERLFAIAAWREVTYFDDAERAVLALTEAMTRLSDQSDPVPDRIWNEVTRYYDESAIAAIVLAISTINLWNRINASTRQVAGAWAKAS